ncbi:DUF982 domain-containing protein [Rhizobium mongolense]|uniref:Uncharacterized protein DUF982 n=1 Tax=Rhizobium mongolense USDA 1844 TaxID=1079460 RepID=A0A559SPJ6_9HYPH|nr:DUF982 domain-containing protein [Rhizobium mongolense]TVZ64235.1 uncharacterized protein DUF982 [Rhizobium mongolense USDA 1844]
MAEVIKVDFGVTWSSPVHVRVGNGIRQEISGPDAALECLKHRWPEKRCELYAQARQLCLAAVCKHGSLELARQAFVNAAADAKMLA